MTTQTKDINMISGGVRSYVNVSQYDVGSEIKFALYNNSSTFTPPAGTTVRVEGRKPDGNGFSYSASLSDNVVTVTVTDQMTVLSGEVLCELRLTKDSVDIGTANFILAVEEAPINSDIPISDTEIPAIIELARQEQYNAEAWAQGTRNGVPVSSDDPTYHNNAKWWAQQAGDPIGTAVKEQTNTTGQFTTKTGGNLESCIVAFDPVQSGSGTPSPSNVRPITGHSSVKVGNVGKNKLPLTVSGIKSANTSGTWSGNAYTLNNVTFTILTDNDENVTGIKANGTASDVTTLYVYGANMSTLAYNMTITSDSLCSVGVLGSSSTYRGIVWKQSGGEFIDDSAVSILQGDILYGVGVRIITGYNAQNLMFYPMIRLATDTDVTFEPYLGKTYTISLGQTVYGGSLDVVSGVLTVDRGYTTVGSLNWTESSSPYGRFQSTDLANVMFKSNTEYVALSDSYVSTSNNDCVANVNQIYGNLNGRLSINDTAYSSETAEAFKTARSAVQICYKLATPQTIQLTPTQINTLIGENNIDVPLTGQSLTSAVYREMFTWSDILDAINAAVNA